MLGGEERARQIDVERFVPAVERNARGRPLLAECAGIVESDIEAAIALLRTLDQLFGERLVAYVARQRESVASLVGDFTDKDSSSALRRAATTTLAPARANSFAVARPIPELAPVTIATLPLRSIIDISKPLQSRRS